MTDPVADFLTRLRNANSAHHETVSAPYSKLKGNIAKFAERQNNFPTGFVNFDIME